MGGNAHEIRTDRFNTRPFLVNVCVLNAAVFYVLETANITKGESTLHFSRVTSKKYLLGMFAKFFLPFIIISLIASIPYAYSAHKISLAWDKCIDSDISGYRLFRRQDGEDYDYGNPVCDGPQNFCKASVNAHTNWHFVVRAYNAGMESENSIEVVYDPSIFDLDDDTVIDNVDNCPLISNPGQDDSNEDGIGDVCDYDTGGTLCFPIKAKNGTFTTICL